MASIRSVGPSAHPWVRDKYGREPVQSEVSVRADIVGGAAGLWMATVLHKAAVLGFSFWVGHSLGADGVGVMAAVLAITWVVSTLAGWGLPDRSPFLGASGDRSQNSRRLYGVFFVLVLAVHTILFV